jgi:4-diphosphocytidyl-2-C-methyl-D-erythritol kinase
MVAFPSCKINLGLNILSKRTDGFHELETCFYPVRWNDMLEIIPSNTLEFSCSGKLIPGTLEDNLCLKAYHLIKADYPIAPVKIHLHKIVPIGAGLGGGSADAAFTLRLLNDIFNLQLSVPSFKKYAAKLGSDCSFFIEDIPMLGSGKGELLTPAEIVLKDIYMVLVKPGVHVSTKEAYAGVVPKSAVNSISEILHQPIQLWKRLLVNDFEESIFPKYPIVDQVKNLLYNNGALYASMSGSGSAVYGLFDQPVHLKNLFIGMDYWEGTLN